MTRRSDKVIVSEILDICRSGTHKTNVQYKANLNYVAVNRYLELLLEKHMIAESTIGTQTIFKTTTRGIEFKERIDRLYLEMEKVYPESEKISVRV